MRDSPQILWTVGHSTRTLEDFVGVLRPFDIQTVVDVRRFAGSRRLPQFGADTLREGLAQHDLGYCPVEKLGGRRKADPQSANDGWLNLSFRGYADYTQTELFAEGIDELLRVAGDQRCAMMCAELLWWRCHRSLVADVLVQRGIEVRHILDASHCSVHPYTSPARLVSGRLSYAATGGFLLNARARAKEITSLVDDASATAAD